MPRTLSLIPEKLIILPNLPPVPPLPVVITVQCPGPQEVCIPDNGYTVRWYTQPAVGGYLHTGRCISNYSFKTGINILYTEYEKYNLNIEKDYLDYSEYNQLRNFKSQPLVKALLDVKKFC